MSEIVVRQRGRQPAGLSGPDTRLPLTLAGEHTLLLREATTRAGELLSAVADGRWPAAELAALAGYARAEVLRQASDEESLLFTSVPAREAAGMARDHARLRSAADLLTRVADGEQPMSPGRVAAAARDFIVQLKRHLRAEETLLASGCPAGSGPGTETLGGHPHAWYSLTEGASIDLDPLPRAQAVPAAVDRLLRMRPGEQVELRSGTSLDAVWREISALSPGGYQFAVAQDGPPRWRMRVTRRRAAYSRTPPGRG